MAFNPFHAFRKHQKAFFAALTILCMVVFVLGGALGNFREIGAFFGGNQPRGNELVSLYGKPVTTPDLNDVRVQREIANQYMLSALLTADHYAVRQLNETLKNSKLEQSTRDQLSRILGSRDFLVQLASQPSTMQFVGQQYQQMMQQLDAIQRSLMAPEKKAELDLALRVQKLVGNVGAMLEFQRRGYLYFGGALDGNGLVDFLVWRHQADRLGIQISRPQGIRNLMDQATRSFASESLPDDERRRLVSGLQQRYRSLTPELLTDCLENEFKVQMAQLALLGSDVRVYDRLPPNLTPFELWSFFRDQRTESIIAMLPIPVAQKALLDKVPDPTEDDLKTFFEKNKERLYDPASLEAGFKQPTRIQLEWVRARPDSPLYQNATTAALELSRAMLPVAYETLVAYESENMKWRFRSPSYVREDFLLHDTSTNRAGNVAAAVGQALASSGMQGPAGIAGFASFAGTAALHEASDRIRAGTSILLSGSAGSPVTVAATAAAGFPATEYLPADRIRWAVDERIRENQHRELVSASLKGLEDELRQLSQLTAEDQYKAAVAPSLLGQALASVSGSGFEFLAQGIYERAQDALVQRHFSDLALSSALAGIGAPVSLVNAQLAARGQARDWSFLNKSLVTADAQKAIAKAVAKYHLDNGATRQPRDRYHIGDDPGLEPLREAFDRPWGGAHSPQTNTKMFAQEIFRNVERSALFSPQRFTGGSPDQGDFLYWKTGERPDFVPTFAEVRDQVLLRWKVEKARALVKEAAEQIVAKLPKNTTGEDVKTALKDADPKLAGKLIELDHVAPLVSGMPAMPTMSPRGYEPYKVPAKDVEYPGTIAKDILKMKTEGEAIVVHDQPEDHYYVAVLVHRTTPYELTFFSEARAPGDLLDWYDRDTEVQRRTREALVKQLREEAQFHEIDKEGFRKFGRSGMGNLGG
jgi:hypothetical protein